MACRSSGMPGPGGYWLCEPSRIAATAAPKTSRGPAGWGQAVDVFGQHRASEQAAEVEPEDRDDRRDGRPQPVLERDRATGQALRRRGADVVLTHRLDHVRAGQPDVAGAEDGRESEPGQE